MVDGGGKLSGAAKSMLNERKKLLTALNKKSKETLDLQMKLTELHGELVKEGVYLDTNAIMCW
ncbi:MAG: hypothetical protein HY751_14045 [Nitrospinae bacterium]|nr:hypothetical protein [Nitrospinota bacterium]